MDEEIRDNGATEEPGKDPKLIRGMTMKALCVTRDEEVKVTKKVLASESHHLKDKALGQACWSRG